MTKICEHAITYRGIIVGAYSVEESMAGAFYIWRLDNHGKKIRNIGSTLDRYEACNSAAVYARISSM